MTLKDKITYRKYSLKPAYFIVWICYSVMKLGIAEF